MSKDSEKVVQIDELLETLRMKKPWQYLSNEDWVLLAEVVEKEAKRLHKVGEFRLEAKKRREGLAIQRPRGYLRPVTSLKRKEGRREAGELEI